MRQFLFYLFLIFTITACKKNEGKPEPQALWLAVPANFPPVNNVVSNPLTKEGVELGRRLFYDKRLSGNNRISCASCHQQQLGFADGVALNSIGVSGKLLHRNAPALLNLAWVNNGLFWDGGATNLESQAFAPLTNPDEMHQELFQLTNELKAIPDYVQRFQFVFDDTEIKTGYIAKALAQFQRTLISSNSKYDLYRRNDWQVQLSQSEVEGLQLVQSKCGGCHSSELFTDNLFHNNGIDADFSNSSAEGIFQGRFRVTQNPADLGKYRTPTLRNIFFTAPYMHDGRFATIEEVLQHYASGVRYSATVDPLVLQNAGMPGISMSEDEKRSIITFLKTLSDSSFIRNRQFSNPF